MTWDFFWIWPLVHLAPGWLKSAAEESARLVARMQGPGWPWKKSFEIVFMVFGRIGGTFWLILLGFMEELCGLYCRLRMFS